MLQRTPDRRQLLLRQPQECVLLARRHARGQRLPGDHGHVDAVLVDGGVDGAHEVALQALAGGGRQTIGILAGGLDRRHRLVETPRDPQRALARAVGREPVVHPSALQKPLHLDQAGHRVVLGHTNEVGAGERQHGLRNVQRGNDGCGAVPAHQGAINGGHAGTAAQVDLAPAFACHARAAAPGRRIVGQLPDVGISGGVVAIHDPLRGQRGLAAQVRHRQRDRTCGEQADDQMQQVPSPVHGLETPPLVAHRPLGAEDHCAVVAGAQLGFDHLAVRHRCRVAPVRGQHEAQLVADEQAHALDRRVAGVGHRNLVEHAAHAVHGLRFPLRRRGRRLAHEQPHGPQTREQACAQQVDARRARGVPGGDPQQHERQKPREGRGPAAAPDAALDLLGRFGALAQDVDLAALVARVRVGRDRCHRGFRHHHASRHFGRHGLIERRQRAELAALPLLVLGLLALRARPAFEQFEAVQADHHRALAGQHHLRLVVRLDVVEGVVGQQHVDVAKGVVQRGRALRLEAVAHERAVELVHVVADHEALPHEKGLQRRFFFVGDAAQHRRAAAKVFQGIPVLGAPRHVGDEAVDPVENQPELENDEDGVHLF
ncbi:hypothetical protein D3C85_834240 [compost metagenome]